MITFNLAFGLWFLIGLFCAGISVGYHEISWDDIDFKESLRLIIIFILGPINFIIALARAVGIIGKWFMFIE